MKGVGPTVFNKKKNGQCRYKYLFLGRDKSYFVENLFLQKSYLKHIIKMLEFFIDNIIVMFVGSVFQQTVGTPMGSNCAPVFPDLFLYSYEAYFIQSFSSKIYRLCPSIK